MLDTIDNICNCRSTDQAVVEAPDFTSTSYCPPNSREEDKIVCTAPTTPPHKKQVKPPLLAPQGDPAPLPLPPIGSVRVPVGPAPSSPSSHHCSLPPTSGHLLSSPFNIPLWLPSSRTRWTVNRTTRWTKVTWLWKIHYTPPLTQPPLLL